MMDIDRDLNSWPWEPFISWRAYNLIKLTWHLNTYLGLLDDLVGPQWRVLRVITILAQWTGPRLVRHISGEGQVKFNGYLDIFSISMQILGLFEVAPPFYDNKVVKYYIRSSVIPALFCEVLPQLLFLRYDLVIHDLKDALLSPHLLHYFPNLSYNMYLSIKNFNYHTGLLTEDQKIKLCKSMFYGIGVFWSTKPV